MISTCVVQYTLSCMRFGAVRCTVELAVRLHTCQVSFESCLKQVKNFSSHEASVTHKSCNVRM